MSNKPVRPMDILVVTKELEEITEKSSSTSEGMTPGNIKYSVDIIRDLMWLENTPQMPAPERHEQMEVRINTLVLFDYMLLLSINWHCFMFHSNYVIIQCLENWDIILIRSKHIIFL